MAKIVKCKYCGKEFDRETTPCEKVSNRYADMECYEENVVKRRELTDLIKRLFSPYEPDWKVIGTQLSGYKKRGLTYTGMYHTVVYFFVIQKNDIRKGAGVGIIPHVYERAKAYYKNMDNIYTQTAKIKQQEEITVKQTESVVVIKDTQAKKKLIDFDY